MNGSANNGIKGDGKMPPRLMPTVGPHLGYRGWGRISKGCGKANMSILLDNLTRFNYMNRNIFYQHVKSA